MSYAQVFPALNFSTICFAVNLFLPSLLLVCWDQTLPSHGCHGYNQRSSRMLQLWKLSHCMWNQAKPNRTEPDWACSPVGVCFYSAIDNQSCCTAFSNFESLTCLFVVMSANALDGEVLIIVLHLRLAYWYSVIVTMK